MIFITKIDKREVGKIMAQENFQVSHLIVGLDNLVKAALDLTDHHFNQLMSLGLL